MNLVQYFVKLKFIIFILNFVDLIFDINIKMLKYYLFILVDLRIMINYDDFIVK